ncbi:hypothetical protein SDJN02_22946, partial [Cucurbita argyrosperma subsp. argyrosperma]
PTILADYDPARGTMVIRITATPFGKQLRCWKLQYTFILTGSLISRFELFSFLLQEYVNVEVKATVNSIYIRLIVALPEALGVDECYKMGDAAKPFGRTL